MTFIQNNQRMALSGSGRFCLVALRADKPLFGRGRVESNGTMLFLSSAISFLSILIITGAALSGSAPAFAAPVPVSGDAPVAVDQLRPGNPAVLPMVGTWRFKLEHGTSPAVKGEIPTDTPLPAFAGPDTSDADWKDIPVPANWEVEGFSIPTYQERAGKALCINKRFNLNFEA